MRKWTLCVITPLLWTNEQVTCWKMQSRNRFRFLECLPPSCFPGAILTGTCWVSEGNFWKRMAVFTPCKLLGGAGFTWLWSTLSSAASRGPYSSKAHAPHSLPYTHCPNMVISDDFFQKKNLLYTLGTGFYFVLLLFLIKKFQWFEFSPKLNMENPCGFFLSFFILIFFGVQWQFRVMNDY
jgi:hypothetical protein